MNVSDIKPNLEMSQEQIMKDVAEWLREGSGWTTDGVLEHYFNLVNYKNHQKQIPAPFVIYADFEAVTEKIQGCEPNNNKSYTNKYQKHTSCNYGYKVVCCYDDKYTKPV